LRAKRSNLAVRNRLKKRDCRVAPLLAMTAEETSYETINNNYFF
jgi:hypothetical protein